LNNRLVNNILSGHSSAGIQFLAGSGQTLSGNRIYSNKGIGGLYMTQTANMTVSSNIVLDNAGFGIFFDNTSSKTITSNFVAGNGSFGLYISTSMQTTISSNTILFQLGPSGLGIGLYNTPSAHLNNNYEYANSVGFYVAKSTGVESVND